MTTEQPKQALADVRDAYLRTESMLERTLAAIDDPVAHIKPEALEQGVDQALDDLVALVTKIKW